MARLTIPIRRLARAALLALLLLPACGGAADTGSLIPTATPSATPALRAQVAAVGHAPTPVATWKPGVAAGTIAPPTTLIHPGTLTIGADLADPPGSYTDAAGQPVGIDVDMSAELASRLGLSVQIVDTEFSSLLAKLNSGSFDLVISSMTITPERAQVVDFVPYINIGESLLVAKGQAATIHTLDDLSGRHLAAQSGTTFETTLRDLNTRLREAGKVPVQVDFYTNQPDVLAAVRAGKAIGSLHDSPVSAYLVRQYPQDFEVAIPSFDEAPEGIAVAKSRPDLLEPVRRAVVAMEADGTLAAIRHKWGLP
jgi:polar amino acid transport system substrate-binding protein